MNIFDQLKQVLVQRFAIQADRIKLNTDVQKELQLDSMDALDLMMAVNKTFSIQIPMEASNDIHTVQDLVDCIEKEKKHGRTLL